MKIRQEIKSYIKNSAKCLRIQVKRCVVLEKWVDGCKGGGSGNSNGGGTSLNGKKKCRKISCNSLPKECINEKWVWKHDNSAV